MSRNYAAIEILARYGLDANNITANLLTEDGYYELLRDESGATRYDAWQQPITEWREWPEGFPFEELLEAIR